MFRSCHLPFDIKTPRSILRGEPKSVSKGGILMSQQQMKKAGGSPEEVDARAREIEQQMTDDERFSLIVSLVGAVPSVGVPRDKRIPEDVNNMSAGYTA